MVAGYHEASIVGTGTRLNILNAVIKEVAHTVSILLSRGTNAFKLPAGFRCCPVRKLHSQVNFVAATFVV